METQASELPSSSGDNIAKTKIKYVLNICNAEEESVATTPSLTTFTLSPGSVKQYPGGEASTALSNSGRSLASAYVSDHHQPCFKNKRFRSSSPKEDQFDGSTGGALGTVTTPSPKLSGIKSKDGCPAIGPGTIPMDASHPLSPRRSSYRPLPFHGSHRRSVSSVAFAPDGHCRHYARKRILVCSASADATVKLWEFDPDHPHGYIDSSVDADVSTEESCSSCQGGGWNSKAMEPLSTLKNGATKATSGMGGHFGINDLAWGVGGGGVNYIATAR
mmetsp:Transcript_19814/g.44983  ORF Transcript_19814/g.44983 Transcript_19814/m.44983 type:complete len:275 (-) Transcript_19814:576-1400(-)